MQVSVLGPVRVRADDGAPIEVGGARLRMLLARLALDANRPVTAEALVDGLWGAEPPADAANALQSLVSRLRKALGDSGRLTSAGGGYLLKVEEVDAHRFEQLAARGRRELAAAHHADASAALTEALTLWQGEALSDVVDAPFVQAPAARLADLRAAAIEDRFEAELELGRYAEILADLEAEGAANPLRERLAGLRMRALYAAGRQSDALAVYEQTRAILAEELGVDPSAELRQTQLAVLRGEIAKPRPERDQLPVRLTSFVGRDGELELLSAALSSARLVTLVGPGGAGKTRLATEAAIRHPAYEHGRVWFVPLASVRTGADVTGAVLGALGSLDMHLLNSAPKLGAMDALGRVVDLLRGGEALLVLDNCEHLIGAAAEFAHELLTRLPTLRILATSREPLAVTGETLCHLGPLELPAAERLFVERAAAVRPGFTMDEATSGPVREICRRLDGMPLALELAAARLRSMSVDQIARRLDDRFRLLTSGSRAALPRQRTLRAVVEWSWDLLEKPERVLARRLSLFPSGATVSAIEAICADESLPEQDVLYVLGSLVEKSIVDTIDSAEPRYRMLETIRAYGEERLDEAGERAEITRRFAAYFLDLAERHEPMLRRADQLEAISVFQTEQDNMITALRRAIDTDDAETAYRLVVALYWYWVISGINDSPGEFFADVLAFEGRIPDYAYAAFKTMHNLFDAVPTMVPSFDLHVLIDECVRTGAVERYPALSLALPMLSFMARDPELAEREMRRSLDNPDPWAQACASWVEGFILDDKGDLKGSEQARERAVTGFQQVGDRWGIAMTLAMQAGSYSVRGEHERAIAGFTQGLALAKELNSADDQVQQLTRLAAERMRSGDIDGAWRDLREADAGAEASGRIELKAISKFIALDLARRTGDFARAEAMVAELTAMLPQVPFPARMGDEWLAVYSSALLVSQGNSAEARKRLPSAILSATERGDMPDVAHATQVAARLFHQEGDPELAAWALGASHCLRGAFDDGDPELAELADQVRAELGEQRYRAAYDSAVRLSKKDASARLLAEFETE
ncbi:BTAD domain-containing putative transcriptional regulator [Amycolatopsis sp.]|uniref:BTAD domain-containing putative transcriptional regulator n=1 Tax=Amycolatopsis sp. TaxID=37632 RepID=UPI002D086E7C|nr:BTAD domain-containing putative transcriptional regulator [Amycolatopsis sp.]HVV12353.1 BTAD domain-containing putative transcriptional regulator [Amycolatopsis sp.]